MTGSDFYEEDVTGVATVYPLRVRADHRVGATASVGSMAWIVTYDSLDGREHREGRREDPRDSANCAAGGGVLLAVEC